MLLSSFPLTNEHPLCLSREEWLQPKAVFKSLFDDFDCVDMKKVLHRWLKTMFEKRALAKNKILRVDDVHEQLLRVLEAGYLLDGEEKSVLPVEADWMNPRWWLAKLYAPAMPFDYFPRSLSRKEYYNPYQVFYSCRARYNLPEWRALLRDCFTAGVSTDLVHEIARFRRAFNAYRLLPKLIEAAYLVYVREFWPEENNLVAQG